MTTLKKVTLTKQQLRALLLPSSLNGESISDILYFVDDLETRLEQAFQEIESLNNFKQKWEHAQKSLYEGNIARLEKQLKQGEQQTNELATAYSRSITQFGESLVKISELNKKLEQVNKLPEDLQKLVDSKNWNELVARVRENNTGFQVLSILLRELEQIQKENRGLTERCAELGVLWKQAEREKEEYKNDLERIGYREPCEVCKKEMWTSDTVEAVCDECNSLEDYQRAARRRGEWNDK